MVRRPPQRDVERALTDAGVCGVLEPGQWLGRGQLLKAFAEVGLDSERARRAYISLRRAARAGHPVAGVEVEADGPRHARRFRLWNLPGPGGARRAPRPPARLGSATLDVHLGDNLEVARGLCPGGFQLVYLDPPFNTGRDRSHARARAERQQDAAPGPHARRGFRGQHYRLRAQQTRAYADAYDDYLGFLAPRLEVARHLMTPDGSLVVHLDSREVHYVKVLLDEIFGRRSFMNQIIWAYDFGGRSRSRWPAKHDTLLWYVRDPQRYIFQYDEMERIPYMAPGLVGPDRAARGKTPTDVWWHTIVPTSGRERTGYPDQKPLGVLDRIVSVHSRPGGRVLDLFAGSGTTGEAALRRGRSAVLVDDNVQAIEVMAQRLRFAGPRFHGWRPPA